MHIREVSVRYLPSSVPLHEGQILRNSRQLFEAFQDLSLEPVEVFRVVLVDTKNRLMHFEDVARGSLTKAIVHPREVFWSAVHHRAAAIACLHNHPSGDPEPSRDDRECTKRLYQAGKILGIRLLDHVIVGTGRYFSFGDNELLTDGVEWG